MRQSTTEAREETESEVKESKRTLHHIPRRRAVAWMQAHKKKQLTLLVTQKYSWKNRSVRSNQILKIGSLVLRGRMVPPTTSRT